MVFLIYVVSTAVATRFQMHFFPYEQSKTLPPEETLKENLTSTKAEETFNNSGEFKWFPSFT